MEDSVTLEGGALVINGAGASALIEAGLGEPLGANSVRLEALEGVYALLRERVISSDAPELIRRLSDSRPDFWALYAVFSDLANQGKRVSFDSEADAILQREGEKRSYLVLSVDTPMTLADIIARASKFEEVGWTPVLAIVDEHGTPIYYSVSSRPPSIERSVRAQDAAEGRPDS